MDIVNANKLLSLVTCFNNVEKFYVYRANIRHSSLTVVCHCPLEAIAPTHET